MFDTKEKIEAEIERLRAKQKAVNLHSSHAGNMFLGYSTEIAALMGLLATKRGLELATELKAVLEAKKEA